MFMLGLLTSGGQLTVCLLQGTATLNPLVLAMSSWLSTMALLQTTRCAYFAIDMFNK
jgi:hypothetical protein